MKTKDIAALVALGIILVIIGTVLVNKFGNIKQRHSREIEIVEEIRPDFNQEARAILLGQNPNERVRSVTTPIDLKDGFGNKSPFRSE